MENRIKVRRKTLFIWIAVVIITLVLYYVYRDLFDISFLKEHVRDHKVLVQSLYLIILTFIGLTFIPSTPFAVAGVLLFPPLEAYIINLIGIITSSIVVYYFTQYLRLDVWLESKYPAQIEKVKKALRKKELPIIAGWSFFSSCAYRPHNLCEQHPQHPFLEMRCRVNYWGRDAECFLYLLNRLLYLNKKAIKHSLDSFGYWVEDRILTHQSAPL